MPKKKTHEEFIKDLNDVTTKIIPLEKYVNSKTKIKCHCLECDNIWEITPHDLLGGHGCPNCWNNRRGIALAKTHDYFVNEIKNLHKNIKILGHYTRDSVPIECQCQVCGHIWSPIPNALLNGTNCPKCSKKKRGEARKKTHEEFVSEISVQFPNIKIISLYNGGDKNITCECTICNYSWETTPTNLKATKGCPRCNGTEKVTHDTFKDKLKKINSSVRIIGKYQNSQTPVKCQCDICGNIWEARPDTLTRKTNPTGCPECAKKRVARLRTKTNDQFLDKLKDVTDSIKILENYKSNHSHIKCQCLNCGYQWSPTPHSLLSGKGCPACSESKGEKKIAKFLEGHGIIFKRETKFEELIDNDYLRYDFYIPDKKMCIEYQGIQHVESVIHFGGEKKLNIQKKHDQMKRDYCENNNIKLLEIWYYDFDQIEKILTECLLKEN